MFTSLFSSNTTTHDVLIVGAGISGIAAYLRIAQDCQKVKIIEAGDPLDERLLSGSNRSVVNGFGGAGLYSDRKWSGFPAGSEMLVQNPYELRDSFSNLIVHLEKCLPQEYLTDLHELAANFGQHLGDHTVTSEDIERNVLKMKREKRTGYVKLYPSMTIKKFKDGKEILSHLLSHIREEDIIYNTHVASVEKVDGVYNVTCVDLLTHRSCVLKAKKLVFATGRFGSLDLVKMFPSNSTYNRLELGVRINVDNYPLLKSSLLKLMEDKTVNDPKIIVTKEFFMFNKKVEVEFRTFCVCIPKREGESGYMVNSKDIASNLSTYSGSSSYDEFTLTKDFDHVVKGSNMGIMMRIRDPEVIKRLSVTFSDASLVNEGKQVTVDPTSEFSKVITELEKLYPSDMCHVLYSGINEIVQYITGECINQPVDLYGPCVEGVGEYPQIDKRTYQLVSDPNVFVTGDAGGYVRGLTQSFVMGDMCGKYVCNQRRNEHLLQNSYTQEYQDITLPVSSYNKVVTGDNEMPKLNKAKEMLPTAILVSIGKAMADEEFVSDIKAMANEIVPVMFDHRSEHGAVLYELHHFFLDKSVYGANEQLHYITETSMTEYILLCNAINTLLPQLCDRTVKILDNHLPDGVKECWKTNRKQISETLLKSVSNYNLKSCVLALRTRASIEKRNNYSDIPVMQSALKFKPLISNMYTDENDVELQLIERYIVATFTKFLDRIMVDTINNMKLNLIMCRTKIETQEPAVTPVSGEALYYECHVKVNMTNFDGSSVEYYTKKRLIHDLAGLFEGDTTVLDIFNVMAVSINLLKHPEHGQQFFLTFRTDTKDEMDFVRRHFRKLMNKVVDVANFTEYSLKYITDAECVVYDNNRDLDLPWFPIKTNFLNKSYSENIHRLLSAKHSVSLVTSNKHKYNEYQYNQNIIANGICVYHCNYDTLDGNSSDLQTDVERKAVVTYEHVRRPVIVEGTGLLINDTQFPGALTGKVINDMGLKKFCDTFKNQHVIAMSILIEYDGKTKTYYESYASGKIASSPRGSAGFGWDNVFVVDGLNKTFAEMTFAEKSRYSMRGKLIETYCE